MTSRSDSAKRRSTRERAFRVIALVGTSSLCGAGIAAYLALRSPADTVVIVDNREVMSAILEERARTAVAEDEQVESFPPSLAVVPIDEATTRSIFSMLRHFPDLMVYDKDLYFRRPSEMEHWQSLSVHPSGGYAVRINNIGVRRSAPVAPENPGLRVIVTGDSHIEGVAAEEYVLSGLLEERLAAEFAGTEVEVLNAAVGGYDLYNYLGALARFEAFDPDLYVIVVYGGNDFEGTLALHRYFNRLPPPRYASYAYELVEQYMSRFSGVAQEVGQAYHFGNNPEAVSLASDAVASISYEIDARARAAGVPVLFVYLPPAISTQQACYADRRVAIDEIFAFPNDELGHAGRIADGWLAFLRDNEMDAVDLRGSFSASEECLYWEHDLHISIAGHAVAADTITPRVIEILRSRRAALGSAAIGSASATRR